jgi:parallel beta-helix repeat protein
MYNRKNLNFLNKLMALILLLLVIKSVPLFSQEENDSTPIVRNNLFFRERQLPYDSIPLGAYMNAWEQKLDIQNSPGYYDNANNWIQLGPSPGNYSGWGSIAGRHKKIFYDPNNANIVYVAEAAGGLWKTTNAGANYDQIQWYYLTVDLPSVSSGAFTLDPSTNPTTIYYGTGEAVEWTTHYLGTGIYKSTNGGYHWDDISGTGNNKLPAATKVYQIAVKPGDPNVIFAALGSQKYQNGVVECGLYRTTDGGQNWSVISGTANKHCTDVVFSPNNANLVYAIGPPSSSFISGIGYLRSTDGGMNFSDASSAFPSPGLLNNSYLSICASSSQNIYCLTHHINSGCGDCLAFRIYRSTNGGANFSFVHEDFCVWGYPDYSEFIRVSPWDPDVVFVGGIDLHRSTDGGQNFTYLTDVYGRVSDDCFDNAINTNVHPDQQWLDFYPSESPPPTLDDYKMLVTNDGGVWRSTNGGGNFENLNKNSSNLYLSRNGLQLYKIACDPYNVDNMLGAAQDNGRQHRNLGNIEWSFRAGGDQANVCFSSVTPNNVIGIIMNCNCPPEYSINGGTSFSSCGNCFTRTQEITPMISHPTLERTFFASTNLVYKTTDGGANWNALQGSVNGSYNVTQLAVSPSDIIYAAAPTVTNDPSEFLPKLYISTNNGGSFTDLQIVQQGVPKRWITSIHVNNARENEILMTLSGFYGTPNEAHDRVWRSTNYGANWTSISGNLPDIPVSDLLIYYSDLEDVPKYIAATDLGVYITTDIGENWYELGRGLPNTGCTNLQLHRFSQWLRVGTYGMGVWQFKIYGELNSNPIYVKDNLIVRANVNVDYDIVIGNGGKLTIPASCTVSMAEGTKIIVKDGGTLEAAGNIVTFTSQSGMWGGIEIQGNTSTVTLDKCSFLNTLSPIVIDASLSSSPSANDINITYCEFHNAPITVTDRKNVLISNNTWEYDTDTEFPVCGIDAVGSDNLEVYWNEINYDLSYTQATGISVEQSQYVTITYNTLTNCHQGIVFSNTEANVRSNSITGNSVSSMVSGITADNSSDAVISYNREVQNYLSGIEITNGSFATLFQNNVTSSDQTSYHYSLLCGYNSTARLSPTISGGNTTWDAGQDTLWSSNKGDGIHVTDVSALPEIINGCNSIYGNDYYLLGNSNGGEGEWDVTYNDWTETPNSNKFNISGVTVDYDPYGCGEGDRIGGGSQPLNIGNPTPEILIPDPPQPLIVDYGNGIYDTLQVAATNIQVSEDWAEYYSGVSEVLHGNYSAAVSTLEGVISSFQDSSCAILAMNKIMYCYQRLNADTAAYMTLRNYYLNLASSNSSDTVFAKIAAELSRKCLVKKHDYVSAIQEYEAVISSSNDSAEIVSAEINIIQIYLLMPQNGGNGPAFTGQLGYLRPTNRHAALRMMNSRLFKSIKKSPSRIIPKQFSLSQNYPNPFNPVTTIKYSLPRDVKVLIKVYDIIGKEVKTLVNDFQKAGYYEIRFDGTNFATGVYFYRFEAGEFVQTKKMVLVK